MALGQSYGMPIVKIVNGQFGPIVGQVSWMRLDQGYAALLPAKELKLTTVRYTFEILNENDDFDIAPNVGMSSAVNLFPTPPKVTVVKTKPSAVRSVKAKYSKGAKVKASWAKPTNLGGAKTVTYKVRVTKKNSSKYGSWKKISSTSMTFKLATRGKYTIQIVAVNATGSSVAKTLKVRPTK